jgi:hypothetical protein
MNENMKRHIVASTKVAVITEANVALEEPLVDLLEATQDIVVSMAQTHFTDWVVQSIPGMPRPTAELMAAGWATQLNEQVTDTFTEQADSPEMFEVALQVMQDMGVV